MRWKRQWGEGNISEFQRKKAKEMMSSDFLTIDEKDDGDALDDDGY